MNYYEYDKNDIAKAITKAISEKAESEAVEYLLNERNRKINTDKNYAHLKNDSITQSAQAYINKYKGINDDVKTLYEAKKDAAANELVRSKNQNESTYTEGMGKVKQNYANNRKNIYSAYRRGAMGNEETLASIGLGRGASNAPSSGFGETSRMGQIGAYQNNLYDSYKNEAAAMDELASDYVKSNHAANKEYNDRIFQIADESISRYDQDRQFLYKMERDRVADSENIKAKEYEQMMERLKFESGEEQRAFENNLAEKKFENEKQAELFERAYKLFSSAGRVLSEQMAQVLGIPVGTQYWQYVIASKNASSSATSAAASYKNAVTNAELAYLNYEIDKQNADTRFYEEETARKKLTGDY